jgi:hypothetical protein
MDKKRRALDAVERFVAKLPKFIPPQRDDPEHEYINCRACNIEINVQDCYVNKAGFLDKNCKPCKVKRSQKCQQTLKGFYSVMLNAARQSSKRRGQKGRTPNFLLTREDIEQMAQEQNNLCYISKQPLVFRQRSEWQASIERINNELDYSKENCCLICLEFNTAAQWTRDKLIHAVTTTDTVSEEELKRDSALPVPVKKRSAVQERVQDGVKQYRCFMCEQWLGSYEYDKCRYADRCITCLAEKNLSRENIWLSKFTSLLLDGTATCKRRAKAGRDVQMELKVCDLIEMYQQQRGLCAYSGVRLNLEGEWKVSLERIDPRLSYTVENCCLIVNELNSIDHTASSDDSNVKGSGWSHAKFQSMAALVRAQL